MSSQRDVDTPEARSVLHATQSLPTRCVWTVWGHLLEDCNIHCKDQGQDQALFLFTAPGLKEVIPRQGQLWSARLWGKMCHTTLSETVSIQDIRFCPALHAPISNNLLICPSVLSRPSFGRVQFSLLWLDLADECQQTWNLQRVNYAHTSEFLFHSATTLRTMCLGPPVCHMGQKGKLWSRD